jgi:hypothetical protein
VLRFAAAGSSCRQVLIPSHIFAVASSMGLIPETEATAIITLEHPMAFEFLGDALRSFEPWALRKLARFHQYFRASIISWLWLLSRKDLGPFSLAPASVYWTFTFQFPRRMFGSSRSSCPRKRSYLLHEDTCSVRRRFLHRDREKAGAGLGQQYVSRDELPGVRAHTTCMYLLFMHSD